jgi:hypothetical protein
MKVDIGDHVSLKGWGLRGFSGTVVDKTWVGSLIIALDPPQLRGGHNRLTVRKSNIQNVHSRV